MTMLDLILFGYFPYIATAVLIVGSIARFDLSQYTWKAHSSQMLDNSKRFQIGNKLFHGGILLLFFGHFFGLLTPTSVYYAFGLTSASKQLLAMVAGGIFGTMAFVGMTILLHRRLTNARVRANSSQMDLFILLLLYVQLILGLISIPVSAGHLDGAVMVQLGEWAQRIATFRPEAAAAIADVNIIYKLHIFLGLVMFLVFPFTRLVHMFSAPVWYLGRRYQLVRQR